MFHQFHVENFLEVEIFYGGFDGEAYFGGDFFPVTGGHTFVSEGYKQGYFGSEFFHLIFDFFSDFLYGV
jgi:hypothetical protein